MKLNGARASACMRPIRAWLNVRHPRLYAYWRTRLDPSIFAGLPLTMLVMSALYVAALLSGLTEKVVEAGGTLQFDQAVNRAFMPWHELPFVAAFLWTTVLGTGAALTGIILTATGYRWSHDQACLILPLWLSFLGAKAATWARRFAVARHRPEFMKAVRTASPSFPSTHATGSMAVYGFFAYAIARNLPRREERFEVVFWAGILVALIGFSRVFLSVHHTTDVAAGFLAGLALSAHTRSVDRAQRHGGVGGRPPPQPRA